MNLPELIENQKNLKGFKLSDIPENAKLIIETLNSFYELEIINDNLVTLFGGTTPKGTRFPQPTQCRFIGSTWGGSAVMLRWFGQKMCLEFGFPNFRVLTTSYVNNIQLEEKNGKWNYSFDWNNPTH